MGQQSRESLDYEKIILKNMANTNMEHGEIILYQPDNTIKLEVRIENETVWLTQAQIVNLFQSSKANISEHIRNIYDSDELSAESTVRKFRTVRMEGNRKVTRILEYYNLDMIISVGYRVNSKRGVQFRQWSTGVLKEYLLKGYAINQRVEQLENKANTHDRQLEELTNKVDFFVRTSLPPIDGVFFNGQIFDAYVFSAQLIKSAKSSLVLIDNFVDESVLLLLSKRLPGVTSIIYTKQIIPQLELDLTKHNSQYPPIDIRTYQNAHDRFLIIDNLEVYHIGASLKDLGKKLFAFSKMEMPAKIITDLL